MLQDKLERLRDVRFRAAGWAVTLTAALIAGRVFAGWDTALVAIVGLLALFTFWLIDHGEATTHTVFRRRLAELEESLRERTEIPAPGVVAAWLAFTAQARPVRRRKEPWRVRAKRYLHRKWKHLRARRTQQRHTLFYIFFATIFLMLALKLPSPKQEPRVQRSDSAPVVLPLDAGRRPPANDGGTIGPIDAAPSATTPAQPASQQSPPSYEPFDASPPQTPSVPPPSLAADGAP
jgi:hypothetical protein